MVKRRTQLKKIKRYGILLVGSLVGLLTTTPSNKVEGAGLGGPTHIGTFEGSTTFTTSSSNGVNPGLFIEVMDEYGNLTQYESERGVITVPNTQEGAYVTQAKFIGKTKYRDQDTGELLDTWEEGRNLSLISVENPELKTVGKNLFNHVPESLIGKSSYGMKVSISDGKIKIVGTPTGTYGYVEIANCLEKGKQYSFSVYENGELATSGYRLWVRYSDGTLSNPISGGTFVVKNLDIVRVEFVFEGVDVGTPINKEVNIQIEQNSTATSYEPYQSNLLTVNESITLSRIGDTRDELDLIVGELAQRIGEVVVDGDEVWTMHTFYADSRAVYKTSSKLSGYSVKSSMSNVLPTTDVGSGISGDFGQSVLRVGENLDPPQYGIFINVLFSQYDLQTVSEFQTWLSQHPITVQYQLAEESTKAVVLDSVYYFQPVMNRDIYVNGSILPLVCSVTIPTETLSFIINPNGEVGQQFIAPDFTVVNESPTYIHLELKHFEQTTNVLNDVMPEAHEDWSQLEREQSKDIALALVPKPSDGWKTFIEGERYVADDSNYYLGEVKAKSSVNFTFTASHGLAFIETMSPQYRLSFVFDFFD